LRQPLASKNVNVEVTALAAVTRPELVKIQPTEKIFYVL
jgi:hypothetical protein